MIDDSDHWSELAIVPQALGLVEELTVRENASLPLRFPTPHEPADVDEVLDRLGLTDLAHRPSTGTSLGEQQRTAIARALVARPHLLVADEPTAHQNAAWARALLGEMRTVCTDGGAVLVATHDRELLGAMDRIVTLHDGRVVSLTPLPFLRAILAALADRFHAETRPSVVVGGLEDLAEVRRGRSSGRRAGGARGPRRR